MMTIMKTTELPLAAKLMKEGCKLLGFENIIIHKHQIVEFEFQVEDSQLIDDYSTGRDGIAQYENCRKMLWKIIETERLKIKHSTK